MKCLQIRGPVALHGEVLISGAKNSVLPILAATLLCSGVCRIHNCPKIDDVEITLSILRDLGAKVQRSGHTVTVDTTDADGISVSPEYAGKLRASIVFLGALLARHGTAKLALPGGCPLGARPIDLHLGALAKMGAQFLLRDTLLFARVIKGESGEVVLPFPSVGATENALLFALSVDGTVVLQNAAREPEVCDLVRFLRSVGADISGEGSGTLVIRGKVPLHGTSYRIMPDRMEAASYLCACAGCGGEVRLRDVRAEDLLPVISALRESGCEIAAKENAISIFAKGRRKMPQAIRTAPYPAFPTDAQAPVMAALLRAEGTGVLEETVFERRFSHVREFRKLGAEIALNGQAAAVTGVAALKGADLHASDLRAAWALVTAAMQAEDESRVFGVRHLYRGYENPEGKLAALGADIKTVEIPIEIVYNSQG